MPAKPAALEGRPGAGDLSVVDATKTEMEAEGEKRRAA
jgi:hypothetical protein